MGGGGGGLLPKIEEMAFTTGQAEQHEAATADVAGLGMHHGEGKASGDGGVHRIAAGVENFYAGSRCQRMHADHHGMAGAYRSEWRRLGCIAQREQDDAESGDIRSGDSRHGIRHSSLLSGAPFSTMFP